MPELPEVEVAAKNLRRWGVGRRVEAVDAEATRVLRPGKPRDLQALVGARLDVVDRIGKNLLLTLSRRDGKVGALSHLGMTGKWLRRKSGDEPPRFSRLRLRLDDEHVLHYCDMRLFGRFRMVEGARFDEVAEVRALGPDPLAHGVDAKRLLERLSGSKRPVKVALMDQAVLPGVGNIQANEALFRAGVDPRRRASTIDAAEAGRIAKGVTASLRHTLAEFHRSHYDGGDGADVAYVEEGAENPFLVYERAGEPCPRCGRRKKRGAPTIERAVVGGRSSYFCSACQS